MTMGRTQVHAPPRHYEVFEDGKSLGTTYAYSTLGALQDFPRTSTARETREAILLDPPKLYLRLVPLTRDGYERADPFVYWGRGQALYEYHTDDGEIYAHLRADTRGEAKRLVLGKYPNARFYR